MSNICKKFRSSKRHRLEKCLQTCRRRDVFLLRSPSPMLTFLQSQIAFLSSCVWHVSINLARVKTNRTASQDMKEERNSITQMHSLFAAVDGRAGNNGRGSNNVTSHPPLYSSLGESHHFLTARRLSSRKILCWCMNVF